MSLLFGVKKGFLFPILLPLKCLHSLAHRHLTTESGTGRVLFIAQRIKKCELKDQHFDSAKIQKGETLAPAIKLPTIPFKRLTDMDLSQVRIGLLCHREDSQFHIFSPDTGEVSTLPAVFANGAIHWIYDNEKDHFDAYLYPRKYILAFDKVEEKFRKIPRTGGGRLLQWGLLACGERERETEEKEKKTINKIYK
jgi:hypothetical protein